ncbi:MAG: MBL fold metallo-hydrolase, partial [Myxococcales bacterium]|nr:MBL fold metallo-hydrolase [Myxococcales bacterium]
FRGPIYCSEGTLALCQILLPDAAYLQEEEANYANLRGHTKHHPALPLYTREDAERVLALFEPVTVGKDFDLGKGLQVRFRRAGHILGASMVRLWDASTSVLFTGDLGRPNDALMVAPDVPDPVDYLVCESTYGNRLHDATDPLDALDPIINRTAKRGGILIIPAFAVGRAQALIYYCHRLKELHRIPDLPIFLNSPMAEKTTDLFVRLHDEHRLNGEESVALRQAVKYVRDVEASKALNLRKDPCIIISASGMATGGRVIHHIRAMAPDPRNTILFAGFQAAGTRGEAMVNGAKEVKIHGAYVPIHAEVDDLHNLSAHADQAEILGWLRHFPAPPKRTFITHGEPAASDALRLKIQDTLGWNVTVPEDREVATLS